MKWSGVQLKHKTRHRGKVYMLYVSNRFSANSQEGGNRIFNNDDTCKPRINKEEQSWTQFLIIV